MRIKIDRKLCELHGQCAFVSPELFRIENDTVIYDENVPASLEDKARKAAKVCPQLAISILDN